MKLHCLGTAGYHPSPSRHTSCYFLPEQGIVLDGGSGMFRLTEFLLRDPRQTLDLFLSHAHLDHTFGLTFLLDTIAVTDLRQIRVIGVQDKLDAVREHLFDEKLFPVLPPIDFRPLGSDHGIMQLNAHTGVQWFPLEHPGGSTGFRFTLRDKILCYVTDTVARPEAEYLQFLRGADLLLHECNFHNDYQELAIRTGHSWISAVTDLVRSTRPKKTALIHLNPLADSLGQPLQLDAEQLALNMSLTSDLECVDF